MTAEQMQQIKEKYKNPLYMQNAINCWWIHHWIWIDTEHEECVVLLNGFYPVCGKKICIEEGETEPTPEECWQAFKQYYPGDYEEAMKIKRGEKTMSNDEETLKTYPFKYQLNVDYILDSNKNIITKPKGASYEK